MRSLRVVSLLIGLGLLVFVLGSVELGEVAERLTQAGTLGVAVILVVYGSSFLLDTASWQLMLTSARLDGVWLYRLWNVRIAGEAFNMVVPAASFGGEPVKALLLKRRYGIHYGEGTASLVIARTTNLLALIVFSAIGFAFMLRSETLPGSYGMVAGIGLLALTVGVIGFFAVQRWRGASRLGALLSRGGRWPRLERILTHVQDIDDRFVDFYHRRPGRFAAALGLAFANWMLGALELYCILYFLGHPITLTDAWIVESVVQLVRAGTFLIPAGIGANEVGFILMIQALTGLPSLGLAAALARRAREALWIVWGLAVSWWLSATPPVTVPEGATPHER